MRTITYPFSVGTHGSIQSTSDMRKVWQDRVRAVVNTQIGTRVMRPGFGTNSIGAILNLGTPADVELSQNIKSAFVTWLPSLDVTNVQASIDSANAVLTVEVWFTLPSGEASRTSVTFDTGVVTYEPNLTEVGQ